MLPCCSAGKPISVPPSPKRRVDGVPARLEHLREQLGQQVALAERLRPDDDRACARTRRPLRLLRGRRERPRAPTPRTATRPRMASGRSSPALRGRTRARASSSRDIGRRGRRHAASSGGASCAMRPACITATRSASRDASCRSWVTSSAAMPVSARNVTNIGWRSLRVIASSAPKGSSSSTMRGAAASARANATRCRCPPDSWCGQRAAEGSGAAGRRVSSAGRPPARRRGGRAATARGRRCAAPSSAAAARRPAARSRAPPERHGVERPDVLAVDAHRAGVGLGQPVERAQQRGLARAALAHQRDAFAGVHVERHVVERGHGAEAAHDPRGRKHELARHAGPGVRS